MTYFVFGREVFREVFESALADVRKQHLKWSIAYVDGGKDLRFSNAHRALKAAAVHGKTFRPSKTLVCEALAVHPLDSAKAERIAGEIGIPTHFDSQGRPEFTSFQHRDKYAKAYGYHALRKTKGRTGYVPAGQIQ